MTPDAKRELAKTIRRLRERLLRDLTDALESRYRLGVRVRDAGLDERATRLRARFEAWVGEQVRAEKTAGTTKAPGRGEAEFRADAVKQAAYILLNRLVILRLMEAQGENENGNVVPALRLTAVLTAGKESQGYIDFQELAPALVRDDETEGFAFLLQLVFEDLATELPGLYGPAGVADLVPVPAATLRHVVEELDKPDLASCWSDELTLGWVYQYWNDPEREALDKKLAASQKLEHHEIASKTQMFTERYMVDWLLQNSLGPMWLAMCRKQGWTADIERPGEDGTSPRDRLEERRADWRDRRGRGEVSLTELMPLHGALERQWAYFLPQEIPDDMVQDAAESVRDLRILDPAMGSGHFLVVALDLLFALYREEARHRRATDAPEWDDTAIVERILEYNLNGIDLDRRAVQIAAAALWLKARRLAPDVRPRRLNLVASDLRLALLPDSDPALVELRREVERDCGVPVDLTDTIVDALRGADHLGSLLKVDHAVSEALERHEMAVRVKHGSGQRRFFDDPEPSQVELDFDAEAARASVLDRLEEFLADHSGGDDLGLRLRGEQLAAGVRFVRIVREGAYDLVVANPPYQGTSSISDTRYVTRHYELGKADLYAAFMLRGLELVRDGGISAMLTMRNWMFIKQYSQLRERLLPQFALMRLGDVSWGAFREMRDNPVTMSVFRRSPDAAPAVAVAPTDPQERVRTQEEFAKKAAGLLCHVGRRDFVPGDLRVVPEWPLVYWWSEQALADYENSPLVGDLAPVRTGMSTSDNARFVRAVWEVASSPCWRFSEPVPDLRLERWAPKVMGAKGNRWFDPMTWVVNWGANGVEMKVLQDKRYGSASRRIQSQDMYFRRGIAFACVGADFSARFHRFRSIFGQSGSSLFPTQDFEQIVCLLNSREAQRLASDLNPTISFQVGDVERLPYQDIDAAAQVVHRLEAAFTTHETRREPSAEFGFPGPSPWRYAQEWAQRAVDRPQRPTPAPLPPYREELDPEPPTDHLSYALGVALGRFGPEGEGVLKRERDDSSHALPAGILFLDRSVQGDHSADGLGHAEARPLRHAWAEHGHRIETKRKTLREWLALDFFDDVHRVMYENRPIHWPLSSSSKTFVAWVNIHRMNERTLQTLVADHLRPAQERLRGERADLTAARDGGDKRAARAAESRFADVQKALAELEEFIENVEQCAYRGAPPTSAKCPVREKDAPWDPDLDDGVMINSAGLWPLLEPQWKKPKAWWTELAKAKGRKDYDWSHLAMRYWPTRVDGKCQGDPSLAVAHGCFWRYHADRAWAWELRLQDEIGSDFRIEEAPYRPGGRDLGDPGAAEHRATWLRDHVEEALQAVDKEARRRMGRGKDKQVVSEMRLLEPGLWLAMPESVWNLEIALGKKQGAPFRLLAPDEAAARAAFEREHPERAEALRGRAAQLKTKATLFGDE